MSAACAVAVAGCPAAASSLPSGNIAGFSGGLWMAVTITTDAAHGLTTGNTVLIAGSGIAGVDGTWPITVTGVDTFTLDGSEGIDLGAPMAAGTWTLVP